jgi:hypothetical protein
MKVVIHKCQPTGRPVNLDPIRLLARYFAARDVLA